MLTKQKKIAAIITFAAAGFFCGFFGVSQAFAATDLSDPSSIDAGGAISVSSILHTATGNTAGFGYTFECGNYPAVTAHLGDNSGGFYTFSTLNGLDLDGYHGSCAADTVWMLTTSASQDWYFQWHKSGGSWTSGPGAPPTTASTTIISTAPTGTIASSSPITITITGTVGTTDLASTTAAGNTIRLLSWVGGVDTSFISPNHSWTLSSDGSFTKSYTVTTDLPAGQFKIYASITSAGTYDCSALDTGGVCVPIGGVNIATTTFFTLNSTYFEHITGTSTPTSLYTPQPCGISDLSGCFQNALAALFYPTVSPGQAFQNISQTARGKAPFVYAYQIADVRTALFTASSTADTSINVPLWKLPGQVATSSLVMISSTLISNVPYASTVKVIITAILWLMMAEYVYYRVIRMHDTTTPS